LDNGVAGVLGFQPLDAVFGRCIDHKKIPFRGISAYSKSAPIYHFRENKSIPMVI
jgi:hypothetical protein